MNNEIAENIKRKLAVLEEKVKRLNTNKFVLFRKLSESGRKPDIKVNDEYYAEIQDEISYLNDWIGFYSKEIEKYKGRLEGQESAAREKPKIILKDKGIEKNAEEGIKESFRLVFSEAKEGRREAETILKIKAKESASARLKAAIKSIILKTKEGIRNFNAGQPIVRYALPFFVLLLLISGLFLWKPSITGHIVLSKETAYNASLNLKINESGSYVWVPKQQGILKSIAASGSVGGNGTVKIYIEKDGSKYLVFDNKKLTNASATG